MQIHSFFGNLKAELQNVTPGTFSRNVYLIYLYFGLVVGFILRLEMEDQKYIILAVFFVWEIAIRHSERDGKGSFS